jgi:hypothetical protein
MQRRTKIVLDLVKVKSDWRIANITWQRGGQGGDIARPVRSLSSAANPG